MVLVLPPLGGNVTAAAACAEVLAATRVDADGNDTDGDAATMWDPRDADADKALVAAAGVMVLATLPLMLLVRRAPRVRTGRSPALAFVMSLGVLLITASVSRGVLPSRSSFTCAAPAVLLVLGYLLMSIAFFLRALHLLARATFASQAAAMDLGFANHRDESESVVSKATTTSESSLGMDAFGLIVRMLLGISLRHSASSTSNRHLHASTAAANATRWNLELLSTLSNIVSARTFAVVAVVWSVPGLVGLAVLLGVSPVYHDPSCQGCPLLLDGAIVGLVVALVNCCAAARVLWLCRDVDESLGIFFELVVSAATCGLLMLAGWVAWIASPTNDVSGSWIVIAGGFAMWFFWVPYQVVAVLVERVRARYGGVRGRRRAWWMRLVLPATNSDNVARTDGKNVESTTDVTSGAAPNELPDMRSALRNDPAVLSAFEAFAAKRFVVELLHFFIDVDAFRLMFHEKAPSWRKAKSKLIYTSYIAHGAPLEINISNSMWQRITDAYRACEVKDAWRMELFDEAFDEATALLKLDVWPEFCARGLYSDAKGGGGGGGVVSFQNPAMANAAPSNNV